MLCLAKTTSGRKENRICELDARFGSSFRLGKGRSVATEHIEYMAKRTKRVGGHTSPAVHLQLRREAFATEARSGRNWALSLAMAAAVTTIVVNR
jgi:hypothetical protein